MITMSINQTDIKMTTIWDLDNKLSNKRNF